MRIANNGNVGIGTASSPGYKLDVVGSIKASVQGRFANGSASTPAYSFDADSDTGIYRATTNALGFSTAGTNSLTIDYYKAAFAGDIELDGANKYIYFRTGTNSGLWQEDNFSLRFGTNNIEALELDNSQNATFAGNVDITTGIIELGQNKIDGSSDNLKISADFGSVSGSSTIEFLVDGSEKMRIDNSGNSTFAGNVNIGSSLSSEKLEVGGSIRIRVANTSSASLLLNNTDTQLSIENTDGNMIFSAAPAVVNIILPSVFSIDN